MMNTAVQLHKDFPAVIFRADLVFDKETVFVETPAERIVCVSKKTFIAYFLSHYDLTEAEARVWLGGLRPVHRTIPIAKLPPQIDLHYQILCRHIPDFLLDLKGRAKEISALAQKLLQQPFCGEHAIYSVQGRTVLRKHNQWLIYVADAPHDRVVGKGMTNTFYGARDLLSGAQYAVGKHSEPSKETFLSVQKNYRLFANIPGAMQAIEILYSSSGLFVVEPFCNLGSLSSFIIDKRCTAKMQAILFASMIECVLNIQARGLVHGDIKPANFLVNYRSGFLSLVLTDFEDAQKERAEKENWAWTLEFCPKERLLEEEARDGLQTATFAVDNFALGCTLMCLATRSQVPPWVDQAMKEGEKYLMMKEAGSEHLIERPEKGSWAEICYELTLLDPKARLTPGEALKRFKAIPSGTLCFSTPFRPLKAAGGSSSAAAAAAGPAPTPEGPGG